MEVFMASLIFDAVLVLLLIFFVFRGLKKGFVRAVIELAGWLIAIVVTSSLSQAGSKMIYDNFAKPSVQNVVASQLEPYAGLIATAGQVQEARNQLADQINEMIGNGQLNFANGLFSSLIGQNIDGQAVRDAVDNVDNGQYTVDSIAASVTSQFLAGPITGVLRIILFLIILPIMLILVYLVARWMGGFVNKIPIIGTLNRLLGGLVGVLQFAAVVVVVTVILSILSKFLTQSTWLTPQVIDGTIFYKALLTLIPIKIF